MDDNKIEKNVDQILKVINTSIANLEKAKKLLGKVDAASKMPDFEYLEGIEGVFDGTNLVTEDGSKYEVPPNYAAKSRMVYGDLLKRVEVDGRALFKQISKVPRKKTEGVISKKEGQWFFITDSGSYRISDAAAEFNRVEINDEALAYLPEDNLSAPYAAFDRLVNPRPFNKDSNGADDSFNKKASADVDDKRGSDLKGSADVSTVKKEEVTDISLGNTKKEDNKEKPKKSTKKKKKSPPKSKKSDPGKGSAGKSSVSDSKKGSSSKGTETQKSQDDKKDEKETQSTIVLEEDDLR